MQTCHVYRNGRMAGQTVPPPATPMWPGTPIEPDEVLPGIISLGIPTDEPDEGRRESAMIPDGLA